MESEIIASLIKLGAAGILGVALFVVVRLYYSDLKLRITLMDGQITRLGERCSSLEKVNSDLEQENVLHRDRITNCPAVDCHVRKQLTHSKA